MILAVGIDIADLARFERAMANTPRLSQRLFRDSELEHDGARRPLRSLAGRFAAKEAVFKALGGQTNRWHDVEVVSAASGEPQVVLHDEALRLAQQRGATSCHVSITHDGGIAAAVAILEAV